MKSYTFKCKCGIEFSIELPNKTAVEARNVGKVNRYFRYAVAGKLPYYNLVTFPAWI